MGQYKKIIICIVVFQTILISCQTKIDKPQKYIGKSKSDLIEEMGNPIACGKVVFYKNVSLFEYQNNLYDIYKNINETDTLIIEECRWRNGKKHLIVWWNYSDKKHNLSIDCLEWQGNVKW